MSRIKMILADSNLSHMEDLREQWQNELDFDIHSLVTTGAALLRQIERAKPDVVVMDLLLKEADGFAVLKALKTHPQRPMVVVYSAILDDATLGQCTGYDVDYFVKKPTEAMYFARRIRMLFRRRNKESSDNVCANSGYPARARAKVTQMLNHIGMPAKLSGYRYLRRALLLASFDASSLDDLSSRLYGPIAIEEKTTATNVERSIRYAIEFVFMYGNLDAILDLFGFTVNSSKGKPSNREFIAMLADRMRISA
jgi:two-component system response regulator (stage 0 sporulation protein A)